LPPRFCAAGASETKEILRRLAAGCLGGNFLLQPGDFALQECYAIFQLVDRQQRQIAADRRHWERWLSNVDGDLAREPKRIAEFYETKSHRLEPVGLAYLWPVTK